MPHRLPSPQRGALAAAAAVLVAVAAPASGETRAMLELVRKETAFAPEGARHDPKARYRLPFRTRLPRFVSQGVGGLESHTSQWNRHAWDFVMPIGTRVLAARAGTVAKVRDREGGDDGGTGHCVYVLHADGTFAQYLHLSAGIPVREGQEVARGDLLARSGNTGDSSAPHLHFAVLRRAAGGLPETVPIRFGRGRGFVPRQSDLAGALPRSNVELRVFLDGVEQPPTAEGELAAGRSARLRVEVRRKDGPAEDVTRHPGTEFSSLTPWSLDVSAEGTVSARPAVGFEAITQQRHQGGIVVLYVDPERREIAARRIDFRIPGSAGAAGGR